MVWRMQTNDMPAGPASGSDTGTEVPALPADMPLPGRHRSHRGTGRPYRLSPRFTADEFAAVEAAAVSVGATANGFCADSAVAAASGMPMVLADAQYREELARLQRQLFASRTAVVRFGTNVNQAVAALNATGEAPEWTDRAVALAGRSIRQLDEVIAEVDRRLR
jgi:uncharacterized protein (DUF1778 family)